MWDLIVSVPDHCLSFYFPYISGRHMLSGEPARDQTNKVACAPSEDSDQPSLISLRCPHEESLGPQLTIECKRRL